jgi:cytochrome c oxidase assembly protein subunit 15
LIATTINDDLARRLKHWNPQMATDRSPAAEYNSLLVNGLPIVTLALGLSTVMWVAWFVLHHPGLNLVPSTAGPILVGFQILASISVALALSKHARGASLILSSGTASLLGALANLGSLGSLLVSQPNPGEGPSAASPSPSLQLMVMGYLGISLVFGLVSGIIAGGLGSKSPPRRTSVLDWNARLAWVTVGATLALLLVGGLVTSTASGLAVPDWPSTYGGNMFLYPISLMASSQNIYLEHAHRLFGTLVGLCTLTLMVATWCTDARGWSRVWAACVFLLVCFQGVLGGLRVNLPDQFKAMVHGVLAQVILVGLVLLAVYLGRAYRGDVPVWSEGDRRRRAFATAALHSSLVQLLFGALYRHTGSPHALYTHMGFSLVVVGVAALISLGAWQRPVDHTRASVAIRKGGAAVGLLVALQFMLGWVAFMASPPGSHKPVPTASERVDAEQVPAWKAIARTAHQANGAVMIAALSLLFAHCRRLRRSPDSVPAPRDSRGIALVPSDRT